MTRNMLFESGSDSTTLGAEGTAVRQWRCPNRGLPQATVTQDFLRHLALSPFHEGSYLHLAAAWQVVQSSSGSCVCLYAGRECY